MLSNAEKENDCNGKNNQNDAAVRRLINAGTLGVRLILALRCAVNRQRVNDCGVSANSLIYRCLVGDRGVSGAEVQPGRLRRSVSRRWATTINNRLDVDVEAVEVARPRRNHIKERLRRRCGCRRIRQPDIFGKIRLHLLLRVARAEQNQR